MSPDDQPNKLALPTWVRDIITIILIPLGVWMTTSLHGLSVEMAVVRSELRYLSMLRQSELGALRERVNVLEERVERFRGRE